MIGVKLIFKCCMTYYVSNLQRIKKKKKSSNYRGCQFLYKNAVNIVIHKTNWKFQQFSFSYWPALLQFLPKDEQAKPENFLGSWYFPLPTPTATPPKKYRNTASFSFRDFTFLSLFFLLAHTILFIQRLKLVTTCNSSSRRVELPFHYVFFFRNPVLQISNIF